MRKKILDLTNKLDKALQKVFPNTPKPTDKEVAALAEQTKFEARTKRKVKQGFFKSTFRGEERLKLEAYTMASTDAEKEAILATMKDSM